MKEYIVSYENRYFEDVIVGELIRCKDCKHADEYNQCEFVNWYNNENDYCSRAERKEE